MDGRAVVNLGGVLLDAPVAMEIHGVFDRVNGAFNTGKPLAFTKIWYHEGQLLKELSPAPAYVVKRTYTSYGKQYSYFNIYYGDWIIRVGYFTGEGVPVPKKDNVLVISRFS